MSWLARLALRLVTRLAPEPARDAMIGDLLEEASLRAEQSNRVRHVPGEVDAHAARWLLGQLVRSLPSLLVLRVRRSTPSLLAMALLPMAGLALWAAVGHVPSGSDLTPETMRALVLQMTVLGLAVALPLMVADDLDLSVGSVALFGTIFVVGRVGGAEGDMPGAAADAFVSALPLVAGVGLAVGLLNGVLSVVLRVAAAAVTLVTGTLLAAGLSQADVHLAVATPARLTLDGAATVLLLAAVALAAGCVWLAWPGQGRPRHVGEVAGQAGGAGGAGGTSVTPWRPGGRVAIQVSAVTLTVAAVHAYGVVQLGPSGHGASLLGMLVLPLLGALALWVALGLLADAARPMRTLYAYGVLTAATPLLGFCFTRPYFGAFILAPVLAAPLLVVLASVMTTASWPAALSRGGSGGTSRSRRARVGAMAVAGFLAAVGGAMIGAQGVRDAGFVSQGAFVSIVPLVALVVGGQHVLPRGWPRLVAAAGGALLTAAVAVGTSQPSDNLAPGILPALALAALAGPLWRLVTGGAARGAKLAEA